MFNTFRFDKLYVEDLQKDTLLYVESADAKFKLWKFFTGKFIFDELIFNSLNANLKIDTSGVNNLDFVIKAFSNPEKKKKPSAIEFNFKNIKIANSRFRLADLRYKAGESPSHFDINRLDISNINANISIDYLKQDSLVAEIKTLSLAEKSGLVIKHLNTKIYGWKRGFHTPNITLSLPKSILTIDSVQVAYDSVSDLKDIVNKVRWRADILPSSIVLNDLAPFVGNLKNVVQPITVQGKVKGLISGFSLKNFELKYGKSLVLKTDIDLNGITNLNETFVYANIKKLEANKYEVQDLLSQLVKRPLILPDELARLGAVKYNGNISGFFSNIVAYGNISTRAGNLKTDILLQFENNLRDFRYNGVLKTSNFDLGTILNSKEVGKSSFSISTNGSKLHQKSFQGTAKGKIENIFIHQYNYSNIQIDGSYDGNGFDGSLQVNDPNLDAEFSGIVDLSDKLPVFNFDMTVRKSNLHALNLSEKYENSDLSFKILTNTVGNSLDNLNGTLLLDSIRFENNNKIIVLNQIFFDSQVSETNSKFTITSDLINGVFEGDFKYSTLLKTLKNYVENYIPALAENDPKTKQQAENFINIDLTLSDTKQISDVLELPFSIDGYTTIKGFIDDKKQRAELTLNTPYISLGSRKVQDVSIGVNNLGNKLNLTGRVGLESKKDIFWIDLKAAAENDSLYSQIEWQNQDSINYSGEFQAITKFNKTKNSFLANIDILPTQILMADTIWDLKSSRISINPDTTFTVKNFKFQSKNQYIAIDGTASKSPNDTLVVETNKLQIGYILDLINLKAISIKGITTGKVNVYSTLKSPVFEADLFVQNASLNNARIGDANLHSTWNKETKNIEATGKFFNAKGDTVAYAQGVYIPSNDSLDFTFDAQKLNIGFLQRYLSAVVTNLKGMGTGKVRMFGKSKSIGFEGEVYAENTSATVDYLKTTYSFSDTVSLTQKTISLSNITIYDEDKNTGKLSAKITHDGNFKEMKFDAKIATNNLMALNTKPQDNDFFYGKAYAAGNIHIYGNENDIYFDINVSSQPKTKFYLSIGGAETANSNDFITFVAPAVKKGDNNKEKTTKSNQSSSSNIFLDMAMDITPDADIQLVIDPKAGDRISASGNGNLHLTYDSNNDMRLYGGYTIDKGDYLFTLQNLIRKEFKIAQGSGITWSGDPFHALLDIKAIYSLTASLRDLMSQAEMTRSSVPVDVMLHITDDMMNPAIQFDLDLPTSDETLKYQVKNLINTEEMMNRQVAYLLLVGKFYTPEYARTSSSSSSLLSSTLSPFLSSTLFGQFNNYLSQLGGNLSVGVNIRDTGNEVVKSQEYETEVFYQPNNRLIINGNFGYRNDALSSNKIIGDLDIEYLLTSNGKFRLKAYNHTIDRYTLNSAQFIQGVGLMYKESFNSWNELIQHYRKIIYLKKSKNKTTENDTIQ
ncbi:MAG: translocation/assembly module TamB domain-containing protein [Paludibacteraceae bacterium]